MPVTYARTTLAVRDLTSEFGWDRVLCSSYGRIRDVWECYSTYTMINVELAMEESEEVITFAL